MYKQMLYILTILFFLTTSVDALITGDFTSVERVTTSPVFPETDSDNEIRGFTLLENGFELDTDSGVTATCDYNAFQTVSGNVILNGGRLNLLQDLVFSDATLQTGGYIAGNDRAFHFSSTETIVLPVQSSSSILTFEDTKFSVDSNVLINGCVQFKGNDVFNGNNYVVDFSSTGSMVVNAYLLLENMTIQGLRDSIISLDSSSTLALRNVCWIQEDDFTFDQGTLDIIGDVKITGTSSFIYQSDKPLTIYDHAKLTFDSGMIFNYDVVAPNLVQFESDLAMLYLRETTLTCTNLQLEKGTLTLEGTCPLENFATSESEGLALGDGSSSSNNMTLKILPESGFDIKSGFLVSKNVA